MKKISLLFAFYIIIVSAFCQTSIEVTKQNFHTNVTSTLIREYQYPKTISCVNSTDNTATFILSDQNLQTIEISVDSIVVNDMDISLDTVFFCGRTISYPNDAIIGFFDVNEAFYNTGNVYIQTGFTAGNSSVLIKELTRLVTYRNANYKRHVVCIGSSQNNKPLPCIVDLTEDDIFGYNVCGYEAGHIPEATESFSDIKIVPGEVLDYIVTSGVVSMQLAGKQINIRAYICDDIFRVTGPQDIRHQFCIETTYTKPCAKSDVRLTLINPSVFATVSYQTADNNSASESIMGPHPIRLLVASYDLTSMLGGSLYSMTGLTRSNTLFYTDYTLCNFICRPKTKTLAFLQNYISPWGDASSYTELDYSPVGHFYNTRSYIDSVDKLSCLSLYNIGGLYKNYVMSGIVYNNHTWLKYKMETFSIPTNCSENIDYGFTIYSPLSSINQTVAFNHQSGMASFQKHTTTRVYIPLLITCEEGEESINNNNQ